ncbi:peptidase C39 family protein [Magnetovibrio sp.]|uniref:peptidase C39 family protein n=1 Tax=Magnetovibrio sp. TaxID=2024836 RepID=UPI002F92E775
MIRDAVVDDVPALVDLENRCFETDRLSARSFRRFLAKGKAMVLVDEDDDHLLNGYALVLFHPNTALARLYSLAVDPDLRGRGIARALLTQAESRTLDRDATRMRLEVHQDNAAAQSLYHQLGYRAFAIHPDYYEDHASAVRMEKRLAPHLAQDLNRVPYYAQTLNFTCGPACLIMAMKTLQPGLTVNRQLELQLWREATTIFMTAGHGGCGALGLALAAWRRGFGVDVAMSDETEMFISSVRSEDKKDVIRMVEEGFLEEAAETDIAMRGEPMDANELCEHIRRGHIPIVLISAYRLSGDKEPHWVVLSAFDEHFIYINDPFPEPEKNRFDTDCIGIPITRAELTRMMRFGSRKHFASVVIHPLRKGKL